MQIVNVTSHEKAVNDINRMLSNMDKPKLSAAQQYWQDRADDLAVKFSKAMVVVQIDRDNWQVWNKSAADKCGASYEYVTA